jgi:thioredoxin-dependent peroxiredoxin
MNTRLKNGDIAPEFMNNDLLGRGIKLADYRGRWLLLSFYRYASCPLCNLRVHDLSLQCEKLKAQGLELLAVFQSPAEKLQQYVGKQHPPFPLLPDHAQRLYDLYSVSNSWLGFLKAWVTRLPQVIRSVFGQHYLPGSVEGGIHRIPADFLIDPQGRIVEAYYGRDIGDHLPLQRIVFILETAQQ